VTLDFSRGQALVKEGFTAPLKVPVSEEVACGRAPLDEG
jgi:hypothetical protein